MGSQYRYRYSGSNVHGKSSLQFIHSYEGGGNGVGIMAFGNNDFMKCNLTYA